MTRYAKLEWYWEKPKAESMFRAIYGGDNQARITAYWGGKKCSYILYDDDNLFSFRRYWAYYHFGSKAYSLED